MIVTRRGMVIGVSATAAIAGIGVRPDEGVAEAIDLDWRGLVPDGADVLVLAPPKSAAADAAAQAVGQRRGRTMLHRVAPLARGGFGDLATAIERARGMHVVAVADTAELLVMGTLLQRAGTLLHRAAGCGDLLVARL